MRVAEGLIAGLVSIAPIALLLLAPAALLPGGTWAWFPALAFIAAYGALTLASNIGLAVLRPENFRVRQQGVVARRDKRQPMIDAIGAGILFVYALAWLAFIPLDVFALRLLPPPPPAIAVVGGTSALGGAILVNLAIWQNRFAAPNVQDQTAAGQHVIDTGVYGVIRHPIYAGNLLLFGGLPLWLGSTAAFAGVAVLLAATVGRILVEETHLRAHLPGYADYMRRVRGRMIPFLV